MNTIQKVLERYLCEILLKTRYLSAPTDAYRCAKDMRLDWRYSLTLYAEHSRSHTRYLSTNISRIESPGVLTGVLRVNISYIDIYDFIRRIYEMCILV